MALEIFEDIFNGLLQGFGSVWIVALVLILFGVALMFFVVRLEPLYAIGAISIPVMLYVVYSYLQIGWGLAIISIGLGLLMALALYRIFTR